MDSQRNPWHPYLDRTPTARHGQCPMEPWAATRKRGADAGPTIGKWPTCHRPARGRRVFSWVSVGFLVGWRSRGRGTDRYGEERRVVCCLCVGPGGQRQSSHGSSSEGGSCCVYKWRVRVTPSSCSSTVHGFVHRAHGRTIKSKTNERCLTS
jgi:hypothetical protein